MAVALVDHRIAIQLMAHGARAKPTWVYPQAHGAAQVHHVLLFGQQVDHRMGAIGVEFGAGGPPEASQVAGPLDHGALHPQTQAQEGHPLFPGPANGGHLAVHAPVAKAAGHHHRIHAL